METFEKILIFICVYLKVLSALDEGLYYNTNKTYLGINNFYKNI